MLKSVMSKLRVGPLLIAGLALLVAGVSAPRVAAAEEIVLKGITPWPIDMYWCQPFTAFQKLVNNNPKLKGRLSVEYLGGSEVVPGFEQFEALRNGTVDVVLSATSYYKGQVPEGMSLLYTKKSNSELRDSGFYELLYDIHLKKGGVIYLANAGGEPGVAFRLFLNKKIDKPDLTGLKIRVSPTYVQLVEGLGGTPVTMKAGEVYTALERGVVDGFGWSYGGLEDYGLQEVTKYVIEQSFYSANSNILINKDVWDSLPKDIQDELIEVGKQTEKEAEKIFAAYNAGADARLKEQGLEFIRFSASDTQKYLDAAYDGGWNDLIANIPENGAKLKALSE